MIIRSVEFAGSVAELHQPVPDDLVHVAFSGRSNVGKSSLINVLLERTRRKLAHVSGQPGKTRMLNFYRVNDAFYLVDLPGFGYAKVPAAMREGWKALIESYLTGEPGPAGVVHLVDARHPPKDSDRKMIDFLAETGIPTLIVLTKVDKLNRRGREDAARRAEAELGLEADQVLQFSSKTGEGRDALSAAIEALLAPAPA